MSHTIEKTVRDSETEQVQIVLYTHANATGRLFGGQLLQWIDTVATVVARRHSERDVITASVSSLNFLAPAYLGDTVVLRGRITYTGKTSMHVKVDTFTESIGRKRVLINSAYLVSVALDDEDKPCKVPRLKPETAEEQAEWESAANYLKLQKNRDQNRGKDCQP